MKRIFSLLLALMLVLSLIGCGKVNAPTTSTIEPTISTTAPTEPATNEQVLWDAEGVVIKVIGTPYTAEDNHIGPVVDIYLENNTDVELCFEAVINEMYVNDCKVSTLFSTTLLAGTKQYTVFQFYTDDLTTSGIETITKLTFTMDVHDTKDQCELWPVAETFTVNFN